MPTYEYRCKECGHIFEKLHGMSEEPEVECSRCGEEAERIISGGSGVVFKGSGFYATDYGGGGQTECGRQSPCCDRDQRCDAPPCDD